MSDRLAYHMASLFTRDPIPAYEKELDQKENFQICDKVKAASTDDERQELWHDWFTKPLQSDDISHFENVQSTNWNSMRFKPPPSVESEIGWRVEFRPLDIQLTDFENAALTVFVGMIANLINEFSLDFIIPISMVDRNMETVHLENALLEQKFWFRVDLFDQNAESELFTNTLEATHFLKSNTTKQTDPKARVIKECYIWQVLEGDTSLHPTFNRGLIYLCNKYMEVKKWSASQKEQMNTYLTFLSRRARGLVPTDARFIRDFVLSHPAYKKDSIVN